MSPRRERELGLPGRLREKRTHQRLKASTTTLRAGRHAFVMLANRQGYCERTPAVVTVVFVHRHSWSSPWLRTPLAAPRTGPRLVSIHRAHSTASRTARSERWWVRGWLDSWSMCSTLGFVLPLQRRPPGACSPSPSPPPSTSVVSAGWLLSYLRAPKTAKHVANGWGTSMARVTHPLPRLG